MTIKKIFLIKKALYISVAISLLATITNCGCVNPASPKSTPDPDMKSNENIFVFPENSITIKKFVNLNIMDTLRPGSNYTPSDVSIAFYPGVDMLIADTNNLNIDIKNGTISGSLKLKQRLDCENPIDDNVDNDYVIATFNMVDNNNTINDELKLIVRITNVEIEVKKLEILIDKFHLPEGNALKVIKELYLYEDRDAPDPSGGDDPNNFLSADLIASTSVIGEMYPGSDITKLYDKDDVNNGFVIDTANTNASNIYHRLTFDFNEKVNLEKIAIRSQGASYGGFYFIIRDESNHIINVQRANASVDRRSGADMSATSTYSFTPSYYISYYPISDFDIKKNNNNFNVYENSTNVILLDNLHVTRGYEYERGFVKFSRPGPDIDKFNTNNVFFVYNQLMGLSFKEVPDFEMPSDVDSNNIYELGTVTISNVDGGRIDFPLSVRTLDVPSTVTLRTNQVSLTLDIYTSNVIENLLEYVDFDDLMIDPATAGNFAYNYELAGDDAIYFKTVLNTLKTTGDFGFRSVYENGGEYNFQVHYIPDDNQTLEILYVTIRVAEPQWKEITPSAPWRARARFESVVLPNNDILVIGGILGITNYAKDIWRSSDGGSSWEEITSSTPWRTSYNLQAVGLLDNELLVVSDLFLLNGARREGEDIWMSDRNFNWNNITYSPPWSNTYRAYELVLLKNNDILFILDNGNIAKTVVNEINQNFEVWLSSDKGTSWNLIKEGRINSGNISTISLQVVVLTNNDILNIRGYLAGTEYSSGLDWLTDILLSSDGGTNWTLINSSTQWVNYNFELVVLPNNDILAMGGVVIDGSSTLISNNILRSRDGGRNWSDITPADHWSVRSGFKAVFLPNKGTLVMGGDGDIGGGSNKNDVWLREEYNRHYY